MKRSGSKTQIDTIKKVMYQDLAFSWYITLVFRLKSPFSGTDVPRISRFVVHHIVITLLVPEACALKSDKSDSRSVG